jgi:hypothetical protein
MAGSKDPAVFVLGGANSGVKPKSHLPTLDQFVTAQRGAKYRRFGITAIPICIGASRTELRPA